jgi:hypothetical protein
MVDRKQVGDADGQPVGGLVAALVTALVSACAALGVVAVVWALYASLDEQGFALDRSVVQPVMAWIAGTPAPAPAAAAKASAMAGTVVARQHGSAPRQP